MPTPPEEHDEQLEGLSDALAQVIRRQRELEDRVRALESHDLVERLPVPPPLPHSDPPAPNPLPNHDRQEVAPPPVPEPDHLETTLGLNWINRIAVVTLLLGTAFLFKYGVDNDWFGPGVRVATGVAAAIVSLLAGDRVWRKGQTVFAQGVIGLGLALLYLSIYAAAVLYHLVPPSLAFVVMCGITAGGGWLALLYDSQAIAVLALAGGYLTPPALSTGEDRPWILFGYVFLLNLSGLWLARKRNWKAVEPIAAAATVILYAAWFTFWFGPANRPVATVFAFAFFAQFSVATLPELWAMFQLCASVALAFIWRDHASFVWWNLPIAAGGLIGEYVRTRTVGPIWTLGCFWLPFWLWYSPDASFVAITLAFLMFPPRLSTMALNATLYFTASYTLLNPGHHEYMGLLAAALGGVNLAFGRYFEARSDERRMALGVAIAFATLAVPIQFSGFRVTIAWALEGAVLAWLAARSQTRWLRAGCWIVLTLAIFRLLALDTFIYSQSSEYSTLLNTRFLTFAATTGALWLAARFLAPGADAAVAYIAGHAVFLFGLSLEIGGWVGRNVVTENQSGVQIIAISVMLTIYAVILVVIGVKTQAAIHRILGLALVVLVVAKLYLIDVWVLGRLFRIAAFLALGVLLLALSYLYSRLRPMFDRLVGHDRVN